MVACDASCGTQWVYPCLERSKRFKPTPLRKMGFGMLCTCLAFVAAALVQHLIETSAANTVLPGMRHVLRGAML